MTAAHGRGPPCDHYPVRAPGLLTAVLIAPALALACTACGGQGSTPPDLSGATSSAEPATSSAATPDAPSDATPSSAAAAPATPAAPAGKPECKAADLTVKVTPGSGGGMSHVGVNLHFTNRSNHACQLQGSPGVSFVTGADGRQLGEPATRAAKSSGKVVVLVPTAATDAELLVTSTGPYDPADCKPEKAAGLRVYAPNDTASTFVPFAQDTCSAPGKVMLQVGVVGGS